jgi:cell division protein FtsQ
MARRSDELTQRQRQSQRIMREKAAAKKRKEIIRRAQYTVLAGVALAMAGGGFWLWKTNAPVRVVQAVSDGAYGITARAGFSLRTLYLEGRSRTAMKDIQKALGVSKGAPILRVSLDEMREKLEAIESVKSASVERELPGTLHVRIVERQPVALWQNNGKLSLVDDNGAVMNDIDPAPYRKLPLIVGVEAPKHVTELLTILAAEPDLAGRFAAAVYVGERRWNIRLNGGTEIKLPEENPLAAWRTLAELHTKQKLLDRDVKVIDMRVAGRLFMKVAPQETPDKTADAKET